DGDACNAVDTVSTSATLGQRLTFNVEDTGSFVTGHMQWCTKPEGAHTITVELRSDTETLMGSGTLSGTFTQTACGGVPYLYLAYPSGNNVKLSTDANKSFPVYFTAYG